MIRLTQRFPFRYQRRTFADGITVLLPEFNLDKELEPYRPFHQYDSKTRIVIASGKAEVEAFANAFAAASKTDNNQTRFIDAHCPVPMANE